MTVPIDTYRGYEISFDISNETFTCGLLDWGHKKQSYAGVKKIIDAHIDENVNFKPFLVIARTRYSMHWQPRDLNPILIKSIRKDGRLATDSHTISDYDFKGFMVYNPANDAIAEQIDALRDLHQKFNEECNAKQKELYNQLHIEPLEPIVSDYLSKMKL